MDYCKNYIFASVILKIHSIALLLSYLTVIVSGMACYNHHCSTFQLFNYEHENSHSHHYASITQSHSTHHHNNNCSDAHEEHRQTFPCRHHLSAAGNYEFIRRIENYSNLLKEHSLYCSDLNYNNLYCFRPDHSLRLLFYEKPFLKPLMPESGAIGLRAPPVFA